MLFLIFKIKGERFAIEATRVVEVIPMVEVRPVSGARKGFPGVITYQKQTVPVIDLTGEVSEIGSPPLLSTRIVIVKAPGTSGTVQLAGLLAHGATEIIRSSSSREPAARLNEPDKDARQILTDGKGVIRCLSEQEMLNAAIGHRLVGVGTPQQLPAATGN